MRSRPRPTCSRPCRKPRPRCRPRCAPPRTRRGARSRACAARPAWRTRTRPPGRRQRPRRNWPQPKRHNRMRRNRIRSHLRAARRRTSPACSPAGATTRTRTMATSAEHDEGGSSLIEHLVELRTRLLRAIVALGIALVALLPFANRLYGWFAQPLLDKLPDGAQLIAVEVASPFFAPLKLALFVAVVATMPWLLYQAWAFVAPGLYKREKRLALPLLVSAVLLFYAGCAFAFFVVLPSVFGFLTAITPEGVAMMTDINAYLNFVLVIFLA